MLTKIFHCPKCKAQVPVFFWDCAPGRRGHEIHCAACGQFATFPFGVRFISMLGGMVAGGALLWGVYKLKGLGPAGTISSMSDYAQLISGVVTVLFISLVAGLVSASIAYSFGQIVCQSSEGRNG